MNFRNKFAPLFSSLFCYRRLWQACTIVFLAGHLSLQVSLMTLQLLVAQSVFGYMSVYQNRSLRILEYVNEWSLVICAYHYYCFTDFVDDPILRSKIGYSLIAVTTFILGLNSFVMVFTACKNLHHTCKRCRHQKKVKKRLKELEAIKKLKLKLKAEQQA